MIGTGPIGGKTVETGIVIMSTDAIAADAAGARLLGYEVQGVRHIFEAAQMGLGEADFSEMDFPVMDMEKAMGIFSKLAYGIKISLEHP